jgi:Cdc6-like AAA superfamily ATPase
LEPGKLLLQRLVALLECFVALLEKENSGSQRCDLLLCRHALFLSHDDQEHHLTSSLSHYSIQQKPKFLIRQLLFEGAISQSKSSPLKPLCKHAPAGAVPEYALQKRFAAVQENKEMSGKWILI